MLSIIVPCLNEEKNITNVVNNIIRETSLKKIDIEIIIIDDDSKDNTYKISRKLAEINKNVQIVKHKRNMGLGAAFLTGVKNSKGKSLVMIPGDGECSISDLLNGLYLMEDVDIIIPYVYNKINRSQLRRSISYLYTSIINFTFNTRLNYTNGTVIYKSSTINKIENISTGFFFQTELLLRLIKSGYLYCEIPVFLKKRSAGVSKAISVKSFLNILVSYIKAIIGIYITKSYITPIVKNSATKIRVEKFIAENRG
jgi:glycosyltransferase involved in cell wall biosynthesis